MGTMTVEQIYQDRKEFSKQVFEVASTDMINMGITVVSYTLKDIRDRQGYLKALGMGRTAEVKRDARMGEAIANMESSIKEAEAEQERMKSKWVAIKHYFLDCQNINIYTHIIYDLYL